jgi:hypothetical protein
MANEWKFGTFAWTPVAAGGSDNSQTILTKLQAFLQLCGWETASYSTTDTKYMIRSDHASRDIWRYTGDLATQRCGIRLRNQNYNGGAYNGTARVDVVAYLENSAGTGADRAGTANAEIRINYNTAGINDFLLVGGEDGFYLEAKLRTLETREVGCGFLSTFVPWTAMHGTRDTERKWTSQGITFDFNGMDRLSANRNFRHVCDDGLSSNKSGYLQPYSVRSVTSLITGTGQSYDNRHWIFPLDNILGLLGGPDGTTNYTTLDNRLAYMASFGMQHTPYDDRWRLSPLMFWQVTHWQNTSVYSTSADNNVAGYGAVPWSDPRWWRIFQRIMVAGHLIPPWQLVTDSVTGKQYRIVQAPDSGRPVNVAIEWPGSANEVTIP